MSTLRSLGPLWLMVFAVACAHDALPLGEGDSGGAGGVGGLGGVGGMAGMGGMAGAGGMAGGGGVAQVSAGGRHSCVKGPAGAISCWGETVYGQSTVPPGTYTLVSCGNIHTCAINLDDTVSCWGLYYSASVPEGSFSDVRCGYNHNTCGIRADGSIACWGRDNFGELRPPPGLLVTAIDVGFRHGCAIQLDGFAVC